MVGSCSAFNCTNRHTNKDSEEHISFHRFPKDKMLLEKWLINMKRDMWTPSKSSQICSRHFTSNSYQTSGWSSLPRLKADAVPTIFQFPEPLQTLEKSICQSLNKKKRYVTEVVDLFQSENGEQNENSAECKNAVLKPKRSRLRYLGDLRKRIVEELGANPENILAYTNLVDKVLNKKNKQIKYLRQKIQRLNKRLTNLQSSVLHRSAEKEFDS